MTSFLGLDLHRGCVPASNLSQAQANNTFLQDLIKQDRQSFEEQRAQLVSQRNSLASERDDLRAEIDSNEKLYEETRIFREQYFFARDIGIGEGKRIMAEHNGEYEPLYQEEKHKHEETRRKLQQTKKHLEELEKKTKFTAKIRKLTQTVTKQSSEIEELKREKGRLSVRDEEAVSKCAKLEDELKGLRTEKSQLGVREGDQVSKHKELEDEIKILRDKVKQAESQVEHDRNHAQEVYGKLYEGWKTAVEDEKKSAKAYEDMAKANENLSKRALDLRERWETICVWLEDFGNSSKERGEIVIQFFLFCHTHVNPMTVHHAFGMSEDQLNNLNKHVMRYLESQKVNEQTVQDAAEVNAPDTTSKQLDAVEPAPHISAPTANDASAPNDLKLSPSAVPNHSNSSFSDSGLGTSFDSAGPLPNAGHSESTTSTSSSSTNQSFQTDTTQSFVIPPAPTSQSVVLQNSTAACPSAEPSLSSLNSFTSPSMFAGAPPVISESVPTAPSGSGLAGHMDSSSSATCASATCGPNTSTTWDQASSSPWGFSTPGSTLQPATRSMPGAQSIPCFLPTAMEVEHLPSGVPMGLRIGRTTNGRVSKPSTAPNAVDKLAQAMAAAQRSNGNSLAKANRMINGGNGRIGVRGRGRGRGGRGNTSRRGSGAGQNGRGRGNTSSRGSRGGNRGGYGAATTSGNTGNIGATGTAGNTGKVAGPRNDGGQNPHPKRYGPFIVDSDSDDDMWGSSL